MNFQQLRIIRETVRRRFFVRKGKRLLGLTEPGQELVGIVERILLDTQNIKKLGEQFSNKDRGQLTVATTHTQARYALPRVVTEFKKEFPKVNLVLHEASPSEIVAMLRDGRADIGIATEALQDVPELATFSWYTWHHGIVVPSEHPLGREKVLTLEAIAEWPIVTYQTGFTGRSRIDEAFQHADIIPEIVMTALDADVIKAYVELELGVGIIASHAFSAERDTKLKLLDARSLFSANTSRIAVRRGTYLRTYAYRFIELCSGELTEKVVRRQASTAHAEDRWPASHRDPRD